MGKKLGAVLDALLPATFVATIAGACLAAGDYVALMSVERLLERWALLPPGWGAAHETMLGVAAILLAVPVTGLILWWMYRLARRSQIEIENAETC